MKIDITDELYERIKKLSLKKCWHDELDENNIVNDFAGGNIDDAYEGGFNSGEIMLAREIVTNRDD